MFLPQLDANLPTLHLAQGGANQSGDEAAGIRLPTQEARTANRQALGAVNDYAFMERDWPMTTAATTTSVPFKVWTDSLGVQRYPVATWGVELAMGDEQFPGNPTRSYRR